MEPNPLNKTLAQRLCFVLALALAFTACASTADIRAQREASLAQLEADADALLDCLENEANERDIPVESRDDVRRRVTSEWIAENDSERRRYYLTVIFNASGMAMRVRINRQEVESLEDDRWSDLDPRDVDSAEELDIIRSAFQGWEDDDCGVAADPDAEAPESSHTE